MAETVKVDIAGLIGGGSAVADEAAALARSHASSVSGLAAAESGWVGSSADALVDMAGTWQVTSARHVTALESHAAHIRAAAALFDDMERRNAAELETVRGPADR
ncbi:hypothetical protein B1R94_02855 [Mycolicibacterium litorale]|nr:hypothetical protein B1R94_02855 [Mycolicibacterium litorale]